MPPLHLLPGRRPPPPKKVGCGVPCTVGGGGRRRRKWVRGPFLPLLSTFFPGSLLPQSERGKGSLTWRKRKGEGAIKLGRKSFSTLLLFLSANLNSWHIHRPLPFPVTFSLAAAKKKGDLEPKGKFRCMQKQLGKEKNPLSPTFSLGNNGSCGWFPRKREKIGPPPPLSRRHNGSLGATRNKREREKKKKDLGSGDLHKKGLVQNAKRVAFLKAWNCAIILVWASLSRVFIYKAIIASGPIELPRSNGLKPPQEEYQTSSTLLLSPGE